MKVSGFYQPRLRLNYIMLVLCTYTLPKYFTNFFFVKYICIFTSDKTFSSPSTAVDFCISISNNGWIVWKDEKGQTLDAVYRKQLE